ncbi:uncharacterized protein LOC126375690 isoform X1 [Pectinophora gossypiella]|uniref:uncharacterized protein LOC126375690 isoform X1 n=1 Tax=Pectinophora gossypiella TaxID=13191 RepID=UPI00214F0E31|nr:uncharacterized protein LOC126375690 isoform X1 [Pectinophora gossypiella]
MCAMMFEGDWKQISERQVSYIADVLKKRGFDGAKLTIEPVGKPGDNYAANVKRISANKNGQVFKMIVKIAPTIEQIRKVINTAEIFQNECLMYTKVLPKLTEMENRADIPESEQLRYAACYGCLMEEPNEVILLEDLQVSGYEMRDRFKSLSNDDIKLVLKNFAMLHSSTYALKTQEPDTYSEIKENLYNLAELFSKSEMAMYFTQLENDVMSMMDNEKYKNAIKGIVTQMTDNMIKLCKMDKDAKYSIIQQGDAWTNNILFQMEEGKSVQCCMVDYQQSRINSPVGDLLYMLFNCSDYETRAQHFHEWIDFYHFELEKRLANYGLKANFVYPRGQLDADLKRHGRVSLGQAVLLSSVLLRESGDAAKLQAAMEEGVKIEDVMDEFRMSAMTAGFIQKYKSRIEGLVDSHLALGLV